MANLGLKFYQNESNSVATGFAVRTHAGQEVVEIK